MTYELLCGGPLDGLPVKAVGAMQVVVDEESAKEYPNAAGSTYIRKADGRLHHVGSRWDLA